MRQTLRALLIAPKAQMIADVITGKKCISIRTDHRDYVEGGHMLIGCHEANWAVLATCTKVRHCTMKDVTVQEVWDEGYANVEELFDALQMFYPTLTWDSEITVVRWRLERSALSG